MITNEGDAMIIDISSKGKVIKMVSVVIPAFNEEEAVMATIEEVHQSLKGIVHEIVIVDDGSADSTGDLAAKAGAKVKRHPHNLGYGASLKTGIAAAKYDTIVLTDADGTYPSAEIPVLLQEYQKGFDMVVGARTGQRNLDSIFKSPLRRILKYLVEYTTGRKIPDVNSGLRVFSKRSILPYMGHLCDTFSFTTSLTLAYMMTGRFVSHVPIPYHARIGTTKVRLFRDMFRTLNILFKLYYTIIRSKYLY